MSAAAQALLADLRALGVTVVAAGDKLRYAPASAVNPELRRRLAAEKAGILALLRGAPPPDPPGEGAPGSREIEMVRDRLAALLQGRLWQDSAGWLPKDAGLAPSHARRVADAAMTDASNGDFGLPSSMTRARGEQAVHTWQQVAACIVATLGWSADRAGRAAGLVVDPCFPLEPPPEERDEDGYTEFDRMFEDYLEKQRERFS